MKRRKKIHPIVVKLQQGVKRPNYHLKDGMLYNDDKFCIPIRECRTMLLREALTSRVVGHFGARKNLLNLRTIGQTCTNVAKFIQTCVLMYIKACQ